MLGERRRWAAEGAKCPGEHVVDATLELLRIYEQPLVHRAIHLSITLLPLLRQPGREDHRPVDRVNGRLRALDAPVRAEGVLQQVIPDVRDRLDPSILLDLG